MKKYNVFISYARADDAKNGDNPNPIDDITCRLDQAGLSYWIDREGKYVGENYLREIEKGISSSTVVIFVSSKNSVNSKWAVREISLAADERLKIYQICLDNTPIPKGSGLRLALAGTDKIEYFDAKNREKRMSDLIEIVQNYLREVEEEQKRIEEQRRKQEEEKERIKKLQAQKDSLIERLAHLIGRVDHEMKKMVDLDKELGTEFDGWNKCPICGDDKRDSNRKYCETCGWFFVTPQEYVISKENENYADRLQLSRGNWELIQTLTDSIGTQQESQSEILKSQDTSSPSEPNIQVEKEEKRKDLHETSFLNDHEASSAREEMETIATESEPKWYSSWKKWALPLAAGVVVALVMILWPKGGEESGGIGELVADTVSVSSVPTTGTILGHDWVDLGLSVKWATCNVGASSPEDSGGYYAWGETEEKSNYGWDTYKWCRGTEDSMTKYCREIKYGTVDNKTVLSPEDDVARVKWGGSWRMPTRGEISELVDKCTWKWTTQRGVKGQLVIGPNGNSIFLPAAGRRDGTDLVNRGLFGNYLSATLCEDSSYDAYRLSFHSSGYYWGNWGGRCSGHTVRPVTK